MQQHQGNMHCKRCLKERCNSTLCYRGMAGPMILSAYPHLEDAALVFTSLIPLGRSAALLGL